MKVNGLNFNSINYFMTGRSIRKSLIGHYANTEKVEKLEEKFKVVKMAYKDNGTGYYLPKIDEGLQELVKMGFLNFASVEYRAGSNWVVYWPKSKN